MSENLADSFGVAGLGSGRLRKKRQQGDPNPGSGSSGRQTPPPPPPPANPTPQVPAQQTGLKPENDVPMTQPGPKLNGHKEPTETPLANDATVIASPPDNEPQRQTAESATAPATAVTEPAEKVQQGGGAVGGRPAPAEPRTTLADDTEDDELISDAGAFDEEGFDLLDTVQVSVYVLPEARTRARARTKPQPGRRRIFNAQLALAAIDATATRLKTLVRERHTVPSTPGSMFPARPRPRNMPAGPEGQRRVLWSLQATPAEIAIFDQLAEQAGATSRSELISVALEAYLLPTKRKAAG